MTGEDTPAAEMGWKPDADWNKDDPLDDVVCAAKLTTGFDGLNSNPPFIDVPVPTNGKLAAFTDAAPRVNGGNIGLNSLDDAGTEVDELVQTDEDDDGVVTATVDVISTEEVVVGSVAEGGNAVNDGGRNPDDSIGRVADVDT